MKTIARHILAAFLPVAMLTMLTGCTEREGDSQTAEMEAGPSDLRAEVEMLGQRADTTLANIEAQIGVMDESIARGAQELAQDVRTKRDALNRDLAQLESAPDASSPEIRSRIERVMGDLDQDLESLRFFVIRQRQEFQAAAQRELDEVDRAVASIESRLEQLDETAREEYRVAAEEIRTDWEQLRQDLAEVSEATESQFEEMRHELAAKLAELDKDVREITESINEEAEVTA